jgi:DNA-binding response OmpR family regulator
MRILVVEDDLEARQTLVEGLRDEGHDVRECGNVPTAQVMVAVFRPKVVLVDIGLPVFDGNELAAYIRKAFAKAPTLIAVTGRSGDAGIRRDLFDEVLRKPLPWVRLDELLAQLDVTPT